MSKYFFINIFIFFYIFFMYSINKKPDWINVLPKSDKYEYFVGMANYKFGKDADGLDNAKKSIFTQVSNFILLNVTSVMEQRKNIATKEGKQFFEEMIKTELLVKSNAEISGIVFSEQYNDKINRIYYVLAYIEKEKIKDLIEKNLDPIGYELKKIFTDIHNKYPEINSLSITNFNFKDKYYAGEFSNYIKAKISNVFTTLGYFKEYIDPEFYSYIDRKGLINTKGSTIRSNNEKQALYQKVQGFISGSYWDIDNEEIEIKIKIYDIGKEEKIVDEMFKIKKKVFGDKIKFVPDNVDDFEKKYGEFSDMFNNQDFIIKVWPDKGDNATYKDGEYLIPYFISNKNCYVRIYLIGADGNAMLIFPNYYDKNNYIEKNKLYKIGDPKYSSFVIELGKPYGCEMLVAIASATEFKDKINFEKDVPVYDKEINLKGAMIKSVEGKDKKDLAQSSSTYTIIPR